MTISTKIALAALVLVGGIAGASQAQAGTSTIMFSPDGFENECLDNGGAFSPYGNGYLCELQTTEIACVFQSVYGYCEWEGGQNKREVLAVIGMPMPQSIASDGGPSKAKPKISFIPVDPVVSIPNFP